MPAAQATKAAPRIAVVAGEASGDLLGAHLIEALRARRPDLEFFGIAGPRMQGAGAVSWYPMERLSVRGYVEVLRHLPGLLRMRAELRQRLLADPPDLFIGIDAPDFNLALETQLRAAGIRTIHYVSPSIWAWRGERIKKMAAAAGRVLALFPFEEPIYRQAGVPVSFVGHPLADESPDEVPRDEIRHRLELRSDQPVFAILPGSRISELQFHAALFVDVAKRIADVYPETTFLVPLATRETRLQMETAIHEGGAEGLSWRLLYGHAEVAFSAADVALVASGTATLEAAMYRCPHVIAYRLKPMTYRMVRKKLYLPYVGLPNVLARQFVVPEILQDDATPANLAQALLNLLHDNVVRERMVTSFEQMRRQLRQGAAARAADAVLGELPA